MSILRSEGTFMTTDLLHGERVSVEQDSSHFLVVVNSVPVLRCAIRREAMRYAALIRRSLRHHDGTHPESQNE
jgi:hypothetical protein